MLWRVVDTLVGSAEAVLEGEKTSIMDDETRKQDIVTLLLSTSNCLSVTDKQEKMVIDMNQATFLILADPLLLLESDFSLCFWLMESK